MKRALYIALREYVATVCTKGFVIGLVLVPLMMSGGLLGVAVMQRQKPVTDRSIALIDHSGLVASAIIKAADARNEAEASRPKPGPNYKVFNVDPPEDLEARRLELSDQIRSGQLHAFVEIDPGILHPGRDAASSRIRYHAKNPVLDEVRNWLGGVINDHLRELRLKDAGVDPALIPDLFARVPIEGMGLAERDVRTGTVKAARRQNEAAAVATPMAVTIFGMMLIMMGATPLLQSVMEEKTQRIAEVMLGAVTPWELMLGKVLGGVGVSLTAMAVYVGVSFAGLSAMAASNLAPWKILPWFVVYIVAAIFMYGAVGAALGSACNDARDAQNLQLPLLLPVLIPVFMIMPVIQEPQGAFATGLSFIPPFTPLLMLLRISAPGGVPWWHPWVGLLLLLASSAFALWLGARIFRVGILLQGKPPRLMELLRWGWRG